MNLKTSLALLLVASAVTAVDAQAPNPKKIQPAMNALGKSPLRSDVAASDWVERNFFAPELVMEHQTAIGLTAEQRQSIRDDIVKTTQRFTELQWQQSAANEAMTTLANTDHPDEKEVLAQLDKLLNIESEIKRLHAGLLVRIKDTLTPEQQASLREIKAQGKPNPFVPATKSKEKTQPAQP